MVRNPLKDLKVLRDAVAGSDLFCARCFTPGAVTPATDALPKTFQRLAGAGLFVPSPGRQECPTCGKSTHPIYTCTITRFEIPRRLGGKWLYAIYKSKGIL